MEPRDVHQVGLDELAHDRRGAPRDRRATRASATTWTPTASPSPAIPPTRPRRRRSSSRARPRTSRGPAAVAPRVFGRLPRAGCEVRPVEAFKEKDAPFAYYFPPAVDGSRPGIYYVNTYDLPSRTYSKLASTTYHEAIPGHHFQISLEMEHPSLNVFRRLGARLAGGAYVEGWGLYSERLADELGLYRNAAERFGMLDAQAWRASRLIVDSGMHGLGWSRQQSMDWLLATGLSDTDAVIETDRYIAWPGQALSYMTGMREIRRLRRELEARDGAGSTSSASTTSYRARVAAARDAGPGAADLGDAGAADARAPDRPEPGLRAHSVRRTAARDVARGSSNRPGQFDVRIAQLRRPLWTIFVLTALWACGTIGASCCIARNARPPEAPWQRAPRTSPPVSRGGARPGPRGRMPGGTMTAEPAARPTPALRRDAPARDVPAGAARRSPAARTPTSAPGARTRSTSTGARAATVWDHRRQRVRRPADGLRPGDPGPRRRPRGRLRQRADAPGRQLLAHQRGRGPRDGAPQGAQPVGRRRPG